jgi:hypothetical protein
VLSIFTISSGFQAMVLPTTLYQDLLTQWGHHIIEGSMGKQVKICSPTKLSMRGGRRCHGCLHEGLCSTSFEVEGLSKSSFKKSFWVKVLCFRGWGGWNSNVVRGGLLKHFMNFASHEAIRVCRISQNLQAKTHCDHNESKKHCQKVKSSTQ